MRKRRNVTPFTNTLCTAVSLRLRTLRISHRFPYVGAGIGAFVCLLRLDCGVGGMEAYQIRHCRAA
jgi:hypothetical protein